MKLSLLLCSSLLPSLLPSLALEFGAYSRTGIARPTLTLRNKLYMSVAVERDLGRSVVLEKRGLDPSDVPLSVGVVGATGKVGEEIVLCLNKVNLPLKEGKTGLRLFTSKKSAGRSLPTPFGDITAEEFSVSGDGHCLVVLPSLVASDSKKKIITSLLAASVPNRNYVYMHCERVLIIVPHPLLRVS